MGTRSPEVPQFVPADQIEVILRSDTGTPELPTFLGSHGLWACASRCCHRAFCQRVDFHRPPHQCEVVCEQCTVAVKEEPEDSGSEESHTAESGESEESVSEAPQVPVRIAPVPKRSRGYGNRAPELKRSAADLSLTTPKSKVLKGHYVSYGLYTHNRRGTELCAGFQEGSCTGRGKGTRCHKNPGKAHQCNNCLSPDHGGSDCSKGSAPSQHLHYS